MFYFMETVRFRLRIMSDKEMVFRPAHRCNFHPITSFSLLIYKYTDFVRDEPVFTRPCTH